jgi:hypothetical protein
MNWKPEKLGAEPKKIAVLAALLLVAGYFYFSNSGSSANESPAPARPAIITPPREIPIVPSGSRTSGRSTARGLNSSPREFRPSIRTKDIDTSKVDPNLHLSLLAKLKNVSADAGTRSLFDIVTPPEPKIEVKEPEKIFVAKFVGPKLPVTESKAGDPAAPADPKAPPIPLKFYGFVNPPKAGIKRAFFLDGEDIVIAGEGDMIKKRYKIVRIGVNSAVVEDTEFKGDNQQTLPLVAEVAG